MKELPRRLRILTVVVRAGALLGAVGFGVSGPLLWANERWVREVAAQMSGAPNELIVINDRARLFGALGSIPGMVAFLFALWQLWQLFGHYAKGQFFASVTQRCLRRFAWGLLCATLLGPVERSWLSIAFTMANPPGKQMLVIGFSTEDYLPILTSAVLLAIAFALSEAARLAEENKLFV